ncbi:hypothetical protein ACXJJ3_32685 [Kribbella sp. WER1]
MTDPSVQIYSDEPYEPGQVRVIRAGSKYGLDAVYIDLRIESDKSPATALKLLARVAIEVVVRARNSKPAQVQRG